MLSAWRVISPTWKPNSLPLFAAWSVIAIPYNPASYAIMLGILQVGLLGMLGNLGLFVAWLARRFISKLEKSAAGFLDMAFFTVIFSMYLTYLKGFVIKAACN